ncbi:hypothetical protein RF11_06339 [Thelohanellus kitauei]|uniref:Uncharacterized protein n=1 Tax=Thelohanellus kitauei TaxID=669202 RepID=A0A0C2JHA1_THEKT|nr:hypothetical protein RF11_06339 [Thelohanellus kitauei]
MVADPCSQGFDTILKKRNSLIDDHLCAAPSTALDIGLDALEHNASPGGHIRPAASLYMARKDQCQSRNADIQASLKSRISRLAPKAFRNSNCGPLFKEIMHH